METNINKQYSHTGMLFPIKLEKGGWYPKTGTMPLVKENPRAIILYNIGFRIRQEEFGTRLWECLEEPNTQALNFLVMEFLRDAISRYEGRIQLIRSTATREMDKLHIELEYKLTNSSSSETLGIEYNL